MKVLRLALLVSTAIDSGNSFLACFPPACKLTRVYPYASGSSLSTRTSDALSSSTVQPILRAETEKALPKIIQGGMGVRISSWQLAQAVSKKGGLGVVSGTAMDVIFVRTLQDGEVLIFGRAAFHIFYIPHKLVPQNRRQRRTFSTRSSQLS